VFQGTCRAGFLAGATLDALIDVGDRGLPIDNLKTLSWTAVLTFTVSIAKVIIDVDLATDVFAFPALDYHHLTSGETGKTELLYMAFSSRNV